MAERGGGFGAGGRGGAASAWGRATARVARSAFAEAGERPRHTARSVT
ncbi:MAG: hypothetical protein AVDCRST_MAG59-3446 [uncultured Thermomicrobiales bacterium]|uniref:Uncharacterized protein n=1 Tax=uncultured Thermomicrobiales bacterium TaxID=1645740 RepID=A0A6J4V8T5_9BACT|nr:MAG: hypothetical protein AVDCRST_MAG59-3446 [uncultured Thermomicrobiales bacterium]